MNALGVLSPDTRVLPRNVSRHCSVRLAYNSCIRQLNFTPLADAAPTAWPHLCTTALEST
eukprot:COSAG02_NODE_43397_length_375_cov_0.753623_2_plen_59_part_01